VAVATAGVVQFAEDWSVDSLLIDRNVRSLPSRIAVSTTAWSGIRRRC